MSLRLYQDLCLKNCMVNTKHFLIHILPEAALKKELLEVDSTTMAVIFCSDEKNSYSELKPIMLVVSFSDTTSRDQADAISTEQAREIISFVKSLPADIQDLYISCSAGQSRSPAIAAAVIRMYGRNDDAIWNNPFYTPNTLVYQVICQEAGLFAPQCYVEKLKQRNDMCFRRAKENGFSCGYEQWEIIGTD